jgi:hypothetical protein
MWIMAEIIAGIVSTTIDITPPSNPDTQDFYLVYDVAPTFF